MTSAFEQTTAASEDHPPVCGEPALVSVPLRMRGERRVTMLDAERRTR